MGEVVRTLVMMDGKGIRKTSGVAIIMCRRCKTPGPTEEEKEEVDEDDNDEEEEEEEKQIESETEKEE